MNSSLRLSGGRSAAALVATLALAAGLTACGSDDPDDTATDPASSSSPSGEPTSETPSETPTETPPPDSGSGAQATIPATGSAGVTEVTLISATEGGGSDSTLALALDTDQARADFAAQFDGAFAETVSTTSTEVAERDAGATAYGATVAIGCEAPRSVAVEAGEAGFEVIPKLPRSSVQCLAPMTYVVLFAVPNA
ncbi:hypothetical protein SAMN05192575_101493 [Nocardioides alpinus]|uniref:Lipoprotein n=1 Tax=Nocardioides alpinus TaxID=748909 RepID=A0A1I0VVE6_9ACTN|nr:hypothetical protein [Nocardioides alpinus]PKH37508.1 hypothetical protein CXG46_18865 [Nocardioides alpinus]SFA80312.1 hypothetical protein SAMN05192575_101493 [Nocardioides alpinus]